MLQNLEKDSEGDCVVTFGSADKRVGRAITGTVLSVCLMLASCGGGGGGGGGNSPPPTSPAPPAAPALGSETYPLSTGDRRSWRVSEAGSAPTIRHERVGEAVGSALTVRELTLQSFGSDALRPDEETLLQRTTAALTEVPGPQADPLSRAFGPVELLRFGVQQGQRVRLVDRTASADVDGDGRLDAVDLRIDSEFLGIEAVSTEAGSFSNAHRVRTQVTIVFRLAVASQPTQSDLTTEEWLVPDIGPVRRTLNSRTGNAAAESSTEELVAYKVGTRRNEQAMPAVSSTSPLNDSFSRPDVQIDLQFNRPLDPLSLIGQAGLQLLRDGQAVGPTAILMLPDARSLRISTTTYPLPDGQYELRHTGQASDWAGNLLPNVLLRFGVDTQGPRLISSSPADGDQEAARGGRIEFRFNEPLVRSPGVEVNIVVRAEANSQVTLIPATVSGNLVFADLPVDLAVNTVYNAGVSASAITDAQGNSFAIPTIRFRTDPGPFSRPETWWPGVTDVTLAAVDMDGDGREDLLALGQVIGTDTNRLAVRLQRSSGGFGPVRELYSTSASSCTKRLATVDINRDGRLDVILPQCGFVIPLTALLQRVDGGFDAETVPVLDSSGFWTGKAMKLANGEPALVWRGSAGLSLWQRQASGQWQLSAAQPGGQPFSEVEVADLNGDGTQDLIWLQSAGSGTGIDLAWTLQDAGGNWSGIRAVQAPFVLATSLKAVDLNQDRRPDIVISGSTFNGNGSLVLMRATVSGSFGVLQEVDYGPRPGGVAAADLNGDGRADLVVADQSFRSGVLLQTPGGEFQAPTRFEAGFGDVERTNPVAILDLNGDGRLDIVQGAVVLYGRAFQGAWPQGLLAPPTGMSSLSVLRVVPPPSWQR